MSNNSIKSFLHRTFTELIEWNITTEGRVRGIRVVVVVFVSVVVVSFDEGSISSWISSESKISTFTQEWNIFVNIFKKVASCNNNWKSLYLWPSLLLSDAVLFEFSASLRFTDNILMISLLKKTSWRSTDYSHTEHQDQAHLRHHYRVLNVVCIWTQSIVIDISSTLLLFHRKKCTLKRNLLLLHVVSLFVWNFQVGFCLTVWKEFEEHALQ